MDIDLNLLNIPQQPKDTDQSKDNDTSTQADTTKVNSSISIDTSGSKLSLSKYLINEGQESSTNSAGDTTRSKGRLRRHFSKLKPRVSSASPSLHGSRKQHNTLSPDDYVPHQDPETMVSRQNNNDAKPVTRLKTTTTSRAIKRVRVFVSKVIQSKLFGTITKVQKMHTCS